MNSRLHPSLYFIAALTILVGVRIVPYIIAGQSATLVFAAGDTHSLNGSSDDVLVANTPKINGGLTIDAWINPSSSSLDNLAAIVTKWDQSLAGNSYGMWLENNANMLRLVASINPVNGAQETVIGGTVSPNTWTHVAMTYDPATSRLMIYQNGIPVGATLGTPSTIKSTSTNTYIGSARDGGGEFFSGAIGRVEIFDHALTASEIASLARSRPPAIPTATPTPSPTPTPTPTPTPHLELNGQGTITGPHGGAVTFIMSDIEMDQVTPKYFEGKLNFIDGPGFHFASDRITSVTINPNRMSATFSGQSNDKTITYTVTVTANQHPTTGDTFQITASNGYTASGNLTSGSIGISIAP